MSHAKVLVDCFFYKFYMDRNEFMKFDFKNIIPMSMTSRKDLLGDVDRTALKYDNLPENKVLFSAPQPKKTKERALSDDITHKKKTRKHVVLPHFSLSEGTDVNVILSNVSDLNLSLRNSPITSSVRRRSSLNLLI